MSRVAVVGAGVGGLACAVRLARAGHAVTVLEQAPAPGGKCARVERDGFRFDAGPSLLTMPWLVRELLGERVELIRVEPVTRYRFADGSCVELSADLPRALEALETWSPGASEDWARFLGICAAMWRASQPVLDGPPPWPPRPGAARRPPDPRDLLRVRPWHTLRTLARAVIRDPRLRLVVERFATYAGADPRRAPAVLAVAGYVEHAFGAWHVRGGMYALVEALVEELRSAGGELRCGVRARALTLAGGATTTPWGAGGGRGRVAGVQTDAGTVAADAVVFNGDAPSPGERSLSGFALMLGLRGREPDRAHHEIRFCADYDAEFHDVFRARRPRPATRRCYCRRRGSAIRARRRPEPRACSSSPTRRAEASTGTPRASATKRRCAIASASRASASRSRCGARRPTSSARRAPSAARSTASPPTAASERCRRPPPTCAGSAACCGSAARRIPAAGCRS